MRPPPETYRLLQVFLSARGRGIFEVHYSPNERKLWCSCYGWQKFQVCRHIDYVRTVLRAHHGAYPMNLFVDEAFDAEDLADMVIHLTNEEYRLWLIEHGKVVVI